jgi:hypothetical protein
MKFVPILFLLLLSGCFQTTPYQPTPYQPSNPQNTINNYDSQITADQYLKEHRCVNNTVEPLKIIKSAGDYEAIGAFDISTPNYIYDQPCSALSQAFNFCKATPRSIDNCIAGVIFLSSEERKVQWLAEKERKLNDIKKTEERRVSSTVFCKVLSVQIRNESTGATTGGAQLGSTLGQTNYIDSSNFKGYSASSQVGAGLLGAIVGSMLDAPSVTKYTLTYLLQMANGDVKRIEKIQSTETHIPAGVCVELIDSLYLDVANQNKCTEIKK